MGQGLTMNMTAPEINKAFSPLKYRFTVKDFHKLAETGILQETNKIELITGELINMSPIGSAHAGTVDKIVALLVRKINDKAIVRCQNPLILDDYSEPEPDIALVKFSKNFYTDNHPLPQDVLLVIEIADTSIRYDREIKIPLYAKANIPEVWLIDLNQKQLEVYTQPYEQGYRTIHLPHLTEKITARLLPEIELTVSELFIR